MIPDRKHIRYFFFSQYLADGVRISLEILLPSLLLLQWNRLDIGLLMSTGALCISISDGPGPVEHKRNGMLYCILFTWIMAALTGLINHNAIATGVLVAFSAFFFSMFTVFGNRAAAVGTAALLIMVLRMDKPLTPQVALLDSCWVAAGGIWYFLIALIFFRLTPYRPAQRALGNLLHETAGFLRVKAGFYQMQTDIEAQYKKLVQHQVTVNEKQDEARELLYKSREILKEPSTTSKLLVVTFADLVDLYEHINASWYDYRHLQEKFGDTGILDEVSLIIQRIALELDAIGLAIQGNHHYLPQYKWLPDLDLLKQKIDVLEEAEGKKLTLKKILVNLRNLGDRTDQLYNYFKAEGPRHRTIRSENDYARFVTHQVINWTVFKNNLHLSSAVFRHSLRMAITCLAGLVVARLLPYGYHSYWILLTIIVIIKPGFSLTRQRNFERLAGTIAGGVIGLLLLYFVKDNYVLFAFQFVFMIGTYTFVRANYIVMVIFMTPYILILLNLMGAGGINIAEERVLDTVIGSVLSFLASYLLFPKWESEQIKSQLVRVIKADIAYLQQLWLNVPTPGKPVSIDYTLSRKELYVSIANLSAAFQRMQSEPRSKQQNSREIYELVVLNHVLSANMASLSATLQNKEQNRGSKELLQSIRRSIQHLSGILQHLEPAAEQTMQLKEMSYQEVGATTDVQLQEQLQFMSKIAGDMEKISVGMQPLL